MIRQIKYFFLQQEGETAPFKWAPALTMILLLLAFQAAIIYILVIAIMD